jgi:hypothetical protein
MAEEGDGPAGQNGSHPPAGAGQAGVADGVDPAVDGVEPARADAPVYRSLVEAEVVELPGRNHAVLPSRQSRDRLLADLRLVPHTGTKVRFDGHARLRAGTV